MNPDFVAQIIVHLMNPDFVEQIITLALLARRLSRDGDFRRGVVLEYWLFYDYRHKSIVT
jgi:hypothetical protein